AFHRNYAVFIQRPEVLCPSLRFSIGAAGIGLRVTVAAHNQRIFAKVFGRLRPWLMLEPFGQIGPQIGNFRELMVMARLAAVFARRALIDFANHIGSISLAAPILGGRAELAFAAISEKHRGSHGWLLERD